METCGIHGRLINKGEDNMMFTRLSNYCKVPNPCTDLSPWSNPSFILYFAKKIFNIKNFVSLALKPIDSFLLGIPSKVIGAAAVIHEVVKVLRSQPQHAALSEFCDFTSMFLATCDADAAKDMPHLYKALQDMKTSSLKSECSVYRDKVLLPTVHVCSSLRRGVPVGAYTRKWNSDAFMFLADEVAARHYQKSNNPDFDLPGVCGSDEISQQICEKYLDRVLEPLNYLNNESDLATGGFELGRLYSAPPWMFPVTESFFDSFKRGKAAFTKGVALDGEYKNIIVDRKSFIANQSSKPENIKSIAEIDDIMRATQVMRATLATSRAKLVSRIGKTIAVASRAFHTQMYDLVVKYHQIDVKEGKSGEYLPINKEEKMMTDLKATLERVINYHIDDLSKIRKIFAESVINDAVRDEDYLKIANKMLAVADMLLDGLKTHFSKAVELIKKNETTSGIWFFPKVEEFRDLIAHVTDGYKSVVVAAGLYSEVNKFEISQRYEPRRLLRSSVMMEAVDALRNLSTHYDSEVAAYASVSADVVRMYKELKTNDSVKSSLMWKLWEMREKKKNIVAARLVFVSVLQDMFKIAESQLADSTRAQKVWTGLNNKAMFNGDNSAHLSRYVEVTQKACDVNVFSKTSCEKAMKELAKTFAGFEASERAVAELVWTTLSGTASSFQNMLTSGKKTAEKMGITSSLPGEPQLPEIAADDYDLFIADDLNAEVKIDSFMNLITPQDHMIVGEDGESAELKLIRLLLLFQNFPAATKLATQLRLLYDQKTNPVMSLNKDFNYENIVAQRMSVNGGTVEENDANVMPFAFASVEERASHPEIQKKMLEEVVLPFEKRAKTLDLNSLKAEKDEAEELLVRF
eukprot:GDKJ01023063.1.p1 GENE.GDKJ01023063.1~~GDKJ01023063.1.p1  ORF type:complete len:923 (-),score=278.30 GDKJ01023063.1:238-2823(-)